MSTRCICFPGEIREIYTRIRLSGSSIIEVVIETFIVIIQPDQMVFWHCLALFSFLHKKECVVRAPRANSMSTPMFFCGKIRDKKMP